ncbi:MAG: hypothetical protein LAP40_02600 [Acidobacteriia bacterium]|nr:hypothetical protein [Terriglobia bacterium]
MTTDTALVRHVARAEEYVADARSCWNPSRIASCGECAEALRRAVAEMEAACAAAAQGPAPAGVEMRIGRLRSEVDGLARLVDSAMAFCRGLAVQTESGELVHSEMEG